MNYSKKQSGFTLIELLLVILVIAILATIGITQFTNFGQDAREAAVKANLQTLRLGIANMNGLMRTRCAVVSAAWPMLGSLRANDITAITTSNANTAASAQHCTSGTAGQVTNPMDAKFVSIAIPANPWTDPSSTAAGWANNIGNGYNLAAGADCGTTGDAVLLEASSGSRGSGSSPGWCYDEADGEIWANSTCNDGTAACTAGTENTY